MKSLVIKKLVIIIIAFLNFVVINVSGQEHEEDHDHLHDQHKYHLGFGIAGANLTSENQMAPGFDLHYVCQFGEEQNWSLGIGYETIIKENLHSSLTILGNLHPVKFLAINAGPGLTFGKHNGELEVLPTFHTEAVFEFDLNKIHIGPVAGFGID